MEFDEDVLDDDDEESSDRLYVTALLEGSEQDPDKSSEYGYALEKIVEAMGGERVDAEEFEDLRYGEFDGPMSWILESGPPIDLPSNDDFPIVGYRTRAEMQQALLASEEEEDTEDEDDDDDDDDYDDVMNDDDYMDDMIDDMHEVFRYALENKKDVISFYY